MCKSYLYQVYYNRETNLKILIGNVIKVQKKKEIKLEIFINQFNLANKDHKKKLTEKQAFLIIYNVKEINKKNISTINEQVCECLRKSWNVMYNRTRLEFKPLTGFSLSSSSC